MLVAMLATLASADVLCLLPCEVVAATHHDAAFPPPDHCGGETPASSGAPAIAANAESCAGQHAWDGPAADRTSARRSIAPAIAVVSVSADGAAATPRANDWTSTSRVDPPGNPAHTSAPLRI